MYVKKYFKRLKNENLVDQREVELGFEVKYYRVKDDDYMKGYYYFYKIKVPNLSQYDILKKFMLDIFINREIDDDDNIYIYRIKNENNDFDNNNFISFINEIKNYDPLGNNLNVKNITSILKAKSDLLIEVDIANYLDDISYSNDEFLICFYVFNNDELISGLIDNSNVSGASKSIAIEAEVVNYERLNKSSKFDEYPVDDNAKIYVSNKELLPFYTLNLYKTLGKHCPISLSLIGSNNNSFNNFNFPFIASYSFNINIQYEENTKSSTEMYKNVYVINSFGSKERYYFVNNEDSEEYKYLVTRKINDNGELYYNDATGSYLFYDTTTDTYKIYDKNGNYSLYEQYIELFLLKETGDSFGNITTYTWDNYSLVRISNEEDELTISNNTNTGIITISDSRVSNFVNINYSEYTSNKKVEVSYYFNNTLLTTYTLLFDSDSKISKIGELRSNHYVALTYSGSLVTKVNDELKEGVEITPGGGLVNPLSDGGVSQSAITLGATYTKTSEVTYLQGEGYTKLTSFTGKSIYTYYDDLGRKVMDIDDEGRVKSYEYYGSSEITSANSSIQNIATIPLINGSFENWEGNTLQGWNIINDSNNHYCASDEGIYGKCLKIDYTTNDNFILEQQIKYKGKISNFSGFCKFNSTTASYIGGEIVGTYTLNGETETINKYLFVHTLDRQDGENIANFHIVDNKWLKFNVDINIPEGAEIELNLKLTIKAPLGSVAYLDGLNFNNVNTNRTNLIENSQFEDSTLSDELNISCWTLSSNLTDENIVGCTVNVLQHDNDTNYLYFGNKYLMLDGFLESVYIEQEINKKGIIGDQYNFKMLYKTDSKFANELYAKVIFFNSANEMDTHIIPLASNTNVFRFITQTISSKINYKEIWVSIHVQSNEPLYIDNIQLMKVSEGHQYIYDKRNNIVEVINQDNESTKISYNSANKISYISKGGSLSYRYFYDDLGRLINVKDSKGNIVTYAYDELNNLISQTITSGTTTINNNYEYDNNDNQIAFINEFNKRYQSVYDVHKRITAEVLPNNVSNNYVYNNLNQLVEINSQGINNSLTYQTDRQVKTITNSNGDVYTYTYDKYGNLLEVRYKDLILNQFTYNEVVNEMNLGLISTCDNHNNGAYDFVYDDKQRLKEVLIGDTVITKYEYDENDNICAIYEYDVSGNEFINYEYPYEKITYFAYDTNNRLTKVTTDYSMVNYVYDSHNNIKKKTFTKDNKYISTEYDNGYEINSYTLDNYVNKFVNYYYHDVVFGCLNGLGTSGLEPLVNTSTNNISDQVLSFTTKDQYIKYDLNKVNKNLIALNHNMSFNYKKFKEKFDKDKTILLWIKPKATFSDEILLKLLDANNNSKLYLKLSTTGVLSLYKNGLAADTLLLSSLLNIDEWNLIQLRIKEYVEEKKEKEDFTFIVNENNEETTLIISKDEEESNDNQNLELRYLTIGANASSQEELTTKFDIAMLSIGMSLDELYEDENKKYLYHEGKSALNNHPNKNTYQKIRMFNSMFNSNYETYSLCGVLESNRHNKANIKYINTYKPFTFDKTLKDFVYSSYTHKNSGLAVKPFIDNQGVLSLKFKYDSLGIFENIDAIFESSLPKRYILKHKNFDVFVRNNKLNIMLEDKNICTLADVSSNTWYTLTIFKYSNNKARIYLNLNALTDTNGNEEVDFNFTFDKTLDMYLGVKDFEDHSNSTGLIATTQLDGCIKELVMSNIIDEVIDKFTNNQLSYIKMIDDLGMVKNIVATSGNTSVLLNGYTYSKTRVTKEVINTNKMNITYQYDSLGNVTQQKETKGSSSVTKIYQYDALNRLYIENGTYGYKKYNYDPNGNILSVANNSGSLVKTFNYDSTYKSLLTYVSDNIYGKTYSIVYPKDSSGKIISPNPIEMQVNGEITTFVYDNSSRIISFSKSNELLDLNVIYDSSGRRVVKEGPVFDNNGAYLTRARHEFEYDGDLLIYEKIIPLMEYEPYIVETELFYKYDNNGILIGVEVEGKQYFYIRDILGNIKYIIDSSGTTMVEYTYDSWGKLLQKTINSNPLIGYLNSIIYKGYYYDFETQLYWVSSRYYSPELCRWISPDSIEYLDPESINGLNLYCYCYNDPINFVDPDGHAPWWSWALSGLQLVGGIALCFVPGLQGLGASLAIGGATGLIMNSLEPQLAQIVGGVGSMVNGYGAISTGISLMGLGGWSILAGLGLFAIGLGTMAFGANEIAYGFTGTNYIQEWTGMTDSEYAWSYLGLNFASSVGTGLGQRYVQLRTRTAIYNPDGSVKQYRYYKNKSKLYDVDFNHAGNMKFPHYHGWLRNGTRLGKNHPGYLIMILQLFGRIFR